MGRSGGANCRAAVESKTRFRGAVSGVDGVFGRDKGIEQRPDWSWYVVRVAFTVLFVTIAIGSNAVVAAYLSQWWGPVAWMYLAFAQLINLGISFELACWFFAVVLRPTGPPRLVGDLERAPRVAVLELVCDDFQPDKAARLHELSASCSTSSVFVLDDSSEPASRAAVDECGHTVIRRSDRSGFKAGNINHWLRLHGADFDYFVILDNDSAVDAGFVDEMVRYGEHPANADVAVFQSDVQFWNLENPFAALMDRMRPARRVFETRLDNRLSFALPTNNVVVRIASVVAIGGMPTHTLTEDYALGVCAMRHGMRVVRVNVPSWMSMSTGIAVHVDRQTRWAAGLAQIIRAGFGSIPLLTQLRLWMGLYAYVVWPACLAGLTLALWSSTSNLAETRAFLSYITSADLWQGPFRGWGVIMAFWTSWFFALRPLLNRCAGVSFGATWAHVLTVNAVHLSGMVVLLGALARVVLGMPLEWRRRDGGPTRRTVEKVTPMVVILILIVGGIRNPLVAALALPWLIPLLLSPVFVRFAGIREGE